MDRQKSKLIVSNQLIYAANLFIFGHGQRMMISMPSKLLFSVMVIALLLTIDIAFGAGERFLGVQVTAHEQGVIIQQVVSDSPATRVIDISSGQYASLEPGDIIQFVNNVKVSNPAHFVRLIQAGSPVAILRILDVRARLFRDVAAGVGPSNEVAAYLDQGSSNLKDKNETYVSPTLSQPMQQSPISPIPFDINNPLEGIPIIGSEDPRSIESYRNSGGSQDEYIRRQQQKSEMYGCISACLQKCSTIGAMGGDVAACRREEEQCKANCR